LHHAHDFARPFLDLLFNQIFRLLEADLKFRAEYGGNGQDISQAG
jgi:hypothetical protein